MLAFPFADARDPAKLAKCVSPGALVSTLYVGKQCIFLIYYSIPSKPVSAIQISFPSFFKIR